MYCLYATFQIRVTYMLLTVSFFYLVLTSPYAAYSLFFQIRSDDPHTHAVNMLIKTIFFILMYTNHSINFILYCVTGRKFRRELKDLVVCLCCKLCSARRLTSSSSVKTVRSNCVEMEPLNNESLKVHLAAEVLRNRAQYYVSEANDVVSSPPLSENGDIVEINGTNHSLDSYHNSK
jgi:hypothetical protein